MERIEETVDFPVAIEPVRPRRSILMIWIDIGMVLGKEESERLAGPFDRGRSSRLLAALPILAYTPLIDLDIIGNITGPLT